MLMTGGEGKESRGVREQGSRGAGEQRSRGAREQRSRGARVSNFALATYFTPQAAR